MQFLAVLPFLHVDEINDDDATHISQFEYTSDLLRTFHVGLKGILLLVLFPGFAVTTVHIDDVHRLGMLHNEVPPIPYIHLPSERGFDLLVDAEAIENINLAGVVLDDLLLLRLDISQEDLDLIGQLFVIHMDAGEFTAQDIPEQGGGLIQFTKNHLGGRAAL